MKYYRLITESGKSRLCVEVQDDRLADLTSIDGSVTGVEVLAQAASLAGIDIDELTLTILESSDGDDFSLSEVSRASSYGMGEDRLGMPIVPPEIWAAGVTYRTSEMERRRESDTPDIYSKVYSAERPELFLKATPERCVGPFDSVGIRADSTWNVPEPELSFVMYRGDILGYTIGNDMSSRSIEGENPLYLPRPRSTTAAAPSAPASSPPVPCRTPTISRSSVSSPGPALRRSGEAPRRPRWRGPARTWRTGSSATTWWRT